MVPHFPAGKVTGPFTDEDPGCQEPAFQNWDRVPKLALPPLSASQATAQHLDRGVRGTVPELAACASLPAGSHVLPGQCVLWATRLQSLKRKT